MSHASNPNVPYSAQLSVVENGGSIISQRYVTVPLSAIEPPIGWKPRYTIHCAPDEVAQVLSWFARGIRVKVDHAMDRLAGDCFMPMDNGEQAPTWGYVTADDVPARECPTVFSVVAYVEQEFRMPKDAWDRKQYRKAARARGWSVRNVNYGAHGYAWFRSKGVTVWEASDTPFHLDIALATADLLTRSTLDAPETALDMLARMDREYHPYDSAFEQAAIRDGKPIPRWVLNRAEYHLNGTVKSGGNSTWMFDPEAIGDPVKRKERNGQAEVRP
jgi:hypothetical protein